MFASSSGAIDLDALLKAHGHALLSREPHQFFDSVAVGALCNQQGIERAVCFQCFANRVDSGKAVHIERFSLFSPKQNKIPEFVCERISPARLPVSDSEIRNRAGAACSAIERGDGLRGNRFAAADRVDGFVGLRFQIDHGGSDAQRL